jgi:glycosyltransferase involved in cell wall biosynthesis
MSSPNREYKSFAAKPAVESVTAAAAAGKAPKISVVLTTYKRARLLPATINSILAQTFRDFELIITDDCSPDDTEAVGREYEKLDPRVRYRREPKNIGMPGNLNAGILASSGEYVANLHDGDLYEPTLIEKWCAALDAHPNAAFVFNAYRGVDAGGRTTQVWSEPFAPCERGSTLLEQVYFRRWRFDSPVWGTVMARRSAYLEAGLFDPRFGLVADVDMWMKLAEGHDVAYIAEPLIQLPTHEAVPKSWEGTSAAKKMRRQAEQMFLEARARHYRRARLVLELARHWSFVLAARCYFTACKAKARVLRVLKGRGGARAL